MLICLYSSQIIDSFGWRYVYALNFVMALFLFVAFFRYGADDPAKDSRISTTELEYIHANIPLEVNDTAPKVRVVVSQCIN